MQTFDATGRALPPTATVDGARLTFEALDGWPDDDHATALETFRITCSAARQMPGAEDALKELPQTVGAQMARAFFEAEFVPILTGGSVPALFTGYFEPELEGSRERTERFTVPLHRPPPDLDPERPWATRAEIEGQDLLSGRGLEIAWIEHEIDRFFLQVQGSGRIRLADGGTLRVGYGGRNGHPYRSIGQELLRTGRIAEPDLSSESIRAYVLADPSDGQRLMAHNPSYVFFRELADLAASLGPIGTLGHPVTPLRSVAVDPDHVPLGAPVWIEKDGVDPMRRLMVAQDTGSAIKGPQRADIYYGTGAKAGQAASAVRDPGRMVVLLPRAALSDRWS